MHKCKCRNYSPVCLFLLARVEITHTCVYFCARVQKLLTRLFRSARACGFCSRLCYFVHAVAYCNLLARCVYALALFCPTFNTSQPHFEKRGQASCTFFWLARLIVHFKSNQIKSLLLSHHHSTSAL